MSRFAVVSLLCSVPILATAAQPRKATSGDVVVSEKAMAIHKEALVIDGHNDLPWALRKSDGPSFTNINLNQPQKQFNTDIERLKKGNVGAQFWSAYVPAD